MSKRELVEGEDSKEARRLSLPPVPHVDHHYDVRHSNACLDDAGDHGQPGELESSLKEKRQVSVHFEVVVRERGVFDVHFTTAKTFFPRFSFSRSTCPT